MENIYAIIFQGDGEDVVYPEIIEIIYNTTEMEAEIRRQEHIDYYCKLYEHKEDVDRSSDWAPYIKQDITKIIK